MDLEIHRFRETIIHLINASQLPLEVKRMVLNEITMTVSEATKNALVEEIRKLNEKNESEEKDGE